MKRKLTALILSTAILFGFSGCTAKNETYAQLRTAVTSLENFEALQTVYMDTSYLFNYYYYLRYSLELREDAETKDCAESVLDSISEIKNSLLAAFESFDSLKEASPSFSLIGIDDFGLNDISSSYKNFLALSETYYQKLKETGKATDFSGISYQFRSETPNHANEMSNVYYKKTSEFLKYFKSNIMNKKVIQEFKKAALLSEYLYDFTDLAIQVVIENQKNGNCLYLINNPTKTIEDYLKDSEKALIQQQKELGEWKGKAEDIKALNAPVFTDLSKIDEFLSSLENAVDTTLKNNQDIQTYYQTKDSGLLQGKSDSFAETNIELTDMIKSLGESNKSVKEYLLNYIQ